MGRHAEGPKLYRDPRTGIWYVRFTHEKHRYCITTGKADRGEAEAKKPTIYAETIRGKRRVRHGPDTPLEDVCAEWLQAMSTQLSSLVMAEVYAVKFRTFFVTLGGITEATVADYRRTRLRQVKRVTVLKELSALRTFLAWCKEQGKLTDPPIVEPPAKNVTGTADTSRPHKAKATKITEAEAEAIIERLPELAIRARRGTDKHRVRDFFIVAWETALRPITIGRLRVPEHYRKGSAELFIPKESDKARFERGLPLTAKCRAALDRSAPAEGPIFGQHDYRGPFEKALAELVKAEAMAQARADIISKYDFRHGRTTHLANGTTNLAAVQYLVGHRHASTTAKYIEAAKESAAEVLKGSEKGRRR